jgi:tRNA pseudouridine32 synthase / 23S rRNA pseudouridine746 synthase
MITYFEPQPSPDDVPARLPSPFAPAPPPIARRAAAELQAALGDRRGKEGKMFGVLVVADRVGRLGWLCAFSGMLDDRWDVDGFAPPLFDRAARDAFWPTGEAELAAIDAELSTLAAELAPARAALAALDAVHASALDDLRARHRARRARRREARRAPGDPVARHALDQESRGDTAERRRLDAAQAAARAAVASPLATLDARRVALEAHRAARSRHLLGRIHETYAIASARGRTRALRALFAPDEPPGGAGDCAAPKLLGHAYRLGVTPLALAEFWWGAPPTGGGRHAGVYYPACRGKCGPILAHMLDGVDADPAPVFGAGVIAADEPRVVFEDDWIVVVDKPCGLLSVPGRHAQLRDSVVIRLRRRHADASVVHRLDLDTSGLLVAARDATTHAALQRAFARREVDKRYAAWLDGDVGADAGTIELPLRVDVDDRPRQIHDPVHGKPAVTEWRVVARALARTRVVLVPRTGRTHQLRVHAAHPLGLGAPIVGDRLYGRGGERLLLHADALAFTHPRTGARIELSSAAPF